MFVYAPASASLRRHGGSRAACFPDRVLAEGRFGGAFGESEVEHAGVDVVDEFFEAEGAGEDDGEGGVGLGCDDVWDDVECWVGGGAGAGDVDDAEDGEDD